MGSPKERMYYEKGVLKMEPWETSYLGGQVEEEERAKEKAAGQDRRKMSRVWCNGIQEMGVFQEGVGGQLCWILLKNQVRWGQKVWVDFGNIKPASDLNKSGFCGVVGMETKLKWLKQEWE